MAAAEFDELKWEYDGLSTAFNNFKKNSADSSLTNGLIITDLESRIRNLEADVTAKENIIRNLEADVTAKEQIILEKSEQTNMLWEKIRGLEAKMEKSTYQNTDMDLDKKQTKKKCPNKKRKSTEDKLMKVVTDSIKTYKVGLELLIKKENDFIDETEREQYEGMPEYFASSRRRH
ncbi:hypothetical protein RhiirB3_500403 [Rhizophagus irregularis]|nr:hypothetical protein RhiirB3_500403 [Rhizophagus irregularis]